MSSPPVPSVQTAFQQVICPFPQRSLEKRLLTISGRVYALVYSFQSAAGAAVDPSHIMKAASLVKEARSSFFS